MLLVCPPGDSRIAPFFISKFPIQAAVWEKIMGSKPTEMVFVGKPNEHQELYVSLENISWKEIHSFCQKSGLEIPSDEQKRHVPSRALSRSTGFHCVKTVPAKQPR